MVSRLMGDSTALASAIVRCCPIFPVNSILKSFYSVQPESYFLPVAIFINPILWKNIAFCSSENRLDSSYFKV